MSNNIKQAQRRKYFTAAQIHRGRKKGAVSAVMTCLVAILAACGIYFASTFFQSVESNVVDEGFITVTRVPAADATPDNSETVDIIGYLNYTFKSQTNYYSEMNGTVSTILSQSVSTYKQYNDGVLIMADLTQSSLVNSAVQYCFVGDEVIWREAAGSSSTWDGLNTEWSSGEPEAHMTVSDYTATYGLPGTDFSVYVINDETISSDEGVIDNGDGTYSITINLNCAQDMAPCHYVNKMVTTGGLSALPTFDYIIVTYTFDADWQILSSDIKEKYTATMGVLKVGCTANYHTTYEYNTVKAESSDYEEYYEQYVGEELFNSVTVSEPTVTSCLSTAFADVMTEPVVYSLTLDYEGSEIHCTVYVDINNMDIRVALEQFGLTIWYNDNGLYLDYNGVKLTATADELSSLLSGLFSSDSGDSGAATLSALTAASSSLDLSSFDVDALLEQLGSGEFTYDDSSASLKSTIELGGIAIDLEFSFALDGTDATLNYVAAEIGIGGEIIGANLTYGTEQIPALTSDDMAQYSPMSGYVQTLINVISSDVIRADVSYAGEGFSVTGEINLCIADLSLEGNVTITVGGESKQLYIAYTGGYIYAELEGVKICASASELLSLLGADDLTGDISGFDIASLVAMLTDGTLTSLTDISEGGGELTILIKGTELLNAFGVDFSLGEVTLGVSDAAITANALGIDITLTGGDGFTVDTAGYIDVMPYVQSIVEIFESGYISAAVEYTNGDLAVSGTIDININSFAVTGDITVIYQTAAIEVAIAYADGVIYAELGGVKLCGSLDEISALIAGAVGDVSLSADVESVLAQVLALDFEQLLSVSEDNNTLTILIKGTELLNAFGVDFSLGEVTLGVSDAAITANALGVDITLTGGYGFTVDTAGYINVMPYVQSIIEIFESGYISAAVEYTNGDLAVSGTIDININTFAVTGDINVTYQTAEIEVAIAYADGVIYAELGGVKLCGSLDEISALIASSVGDVSLSADVESILAQVLALDFEQLLSVSESNDTLTILIKGTELLNAFGVDFSLGEVTLGVSDAAITANALGVDITLTGGYGFTVDTDGYADITNAAGIIFDIVGKQTIALGGSVGLTYGDISITLNVDEGTLTWADGFALYLSGALCVGDTQIDIALEIDTVSVKLSCLGITAEIEYAEISDITSALVSAYGNIYEKLELASEGENLLAAIGAADDVEAMLAGTGAITGTLSQIDIVDMINRLSFEGGTLAGSLGRVVYDGGLWIELIDGGDGLTLAIGYSSANVTVTANLNAAAADEAITLDGDFITASDIVTVIDYITAAVNTACSGSLTATFSATTSSGDVISGEVEFCTGDGALFYLNTQTSNFYINTGLYMRVSFTLDMSDSDDLYFDLYVLDSDLSGAQDGELDCFIRVSRYGPEDENYNPIELYTPISEVTTLLSQVCAIAGIDVDLINDYLVDKWLTATNVEQLGALGSSLMDTVTAYLSDFGISIDTGDIVGAAASVDWNSLLSNVSISDEQLSLTVSGAAITIDKQDGLLTGISLGVSGTSIGITFAPTSDSGHTAPEFTTPYNATGISALITALAQSATHISSDEVISGEENPEYVINTNFYIDGSAAIALGSIYDLTVDIVAISVSIDENGEIALNIRLEFQGAQELNQVFINGDTQVDITLKGDMIYIKRVQTTEWVTYVLWTVEETLETPITLYRAMTLNNFASDAMNQLAFILNFGSALDSIISSATSGDSSSSGTSVTSGDYGASLQNIFSSYSYVISDDGQTWEFVLNGSALTDGVFGDMTIAITADENGDIRTLNFSAKIYSILSLTAELNYRNPEGVMEDGVTDVTVDVYEECFADIDLSGVDWDTTTYIELGYATVNFIFDGNVISSQENVLCDTTSNTVYGAVELPDLSAYEIDGYTISEWSESGNTYYAEYTPNVYTLTFTSEYEAEGFTYDEDSKLWICTIEYTYGTSLEDILPFTENQTYRITGFVCGGNTYTQTTDTTQIALDNFTYSAVWEYIDYTVEFMIDGNVYYSTTAHYGDVVSAPEEDPEVQGYTFLGWEQEQVTVTGNTVVNAEFKASVYTITLISAVEVDGYTYDDNEGYYVYEYSFTYGTISALPTPTLTSSGYTFCGWWQNADGSWSNVEYSDVIQQLFNGESVTLEALWLSDVSISVSEAKKSSSWGTYTYKVTYTVTGGELSGAFAETESYTTNITENKFTVNNSSSNGSESNGTYTASLSIFMTNKSTGTISYSVTVSYGDWTSEGVTASATVSF